MMGAPLGTTYRRLMHEDGLGITVGSRPSRVLVLPRSSLFTHISTLRSFRLDFTHPGQNHQAHQGDH